MIMPSVITSSSKTEAVVENRQRVLPSRLPSIDGWRALSICLVLGEHAAFTFDCPPRAAKLLQTYFDGSLGVRFFFVISGFLITYLLLKEHVETGKIRLRNFYARRALRILPVYFIYLAVVFALQLLTPFHQSALTWAANLTFTTNFAPTNWTTGHLWTLAVEEQFYFLWPLVLTIAGPQNRRRILLILCVPIVMAPICRMVAYAKWMPALRPLFQNYSFLNQFDSLAMGCMAAFFFVYHRDKVEAMVTRWKAGLILAVMLVLIPQILVKSWVSVYVAMYAGEPITMPLVNTLQGIGFCLLLLQSILHPRSFKELNWKIITQIGVLSYSIYIWQMPFSNYPAAYGLSHPWFMSFRFWWVAVLVVAGCSYYLIERPFMALRGRFRSRAALPAGKTNLSSCSSDQPITPAVS